MYNIYGTHCYTDLSDETKSVVTVFEDGKWVSEEMYYASTDGITKEDLERQDIEFVATRFLFNYNIDNYYDSYELTKTTAKVCGRVCDKYSYKIKDEKRYNYYNNKEYTLNMKASIYIDQEYGFYLGSESSSTMTYADGKEEKSKSYDKCVSFILNYDLVIPTNE